MAPVPRRRFFILAATLSLTLYLGSLLHPHLDIDVNYPTPILNLVQQGSQHAQRYIGSDWSRHSLLGRRQARENDGWLKEREDGSVLVRKLGKGSAKGHPIRQLMNEAKVRWDAKLARQSKTLEEAVENYRLRYDKSPPKGFDAWFEFAQANNVSIVDDFDSLHASISPFLSLPHALLQSRLDELSSQELEYTLSVRRSQPVAVAGEAADRVRPQQLKDLFEGFRHALPADFGEGERVMLSVSDHDLGGRIGNEDTEARLAELFDAGEYITEDELTKLENHGRPDAMMGLLNACARDSSAGREYRADDDMILLESVEETIGTTAATEATSGTVPITFLRNPQSSYSFCNNPKLLPYHGQFSRKNEAKSAKLSPEFVLSRFANGNQILLTPLEAFENETTRISWGDRTTEKIFWRGSTTGDYFAHRDDYNWRNSHRVRLHQLTNAHRGHADVLVELPPSSSKTNARSTAIGEVALERFGLRELNKHLMDVGLASIGQCSEEDGTCAEMASELDPLAEQVWPEDALKYKYSLDIDGNGWSSRFRRLMASGSMVFKTTIFPEWNTDWLEPWLHFVPIQVDLSDLYHTSAFFLGTPDGKGGHDDLARSIADAGVAFATYFWRWEDMQAYNFLLLLEYRRMMTEDRDAMSWGGKLRVRA